MKKYKVTRRKTKTDTQKVKQKDKKHVDDGITYIYKYAAYLGKQRRRHMITPEPMYEF